MSESNTKIQVRGLNLWYGENHALKNVNMDIKEKASYIKGLFDGYELDAEKKEMKIISKLIDLSIELSEKVEELEKEKNELRGYLTELAEDFVALEESVYSEDDEDYADYSDLDDPEEEEYDFDEDDEYYEIECPHCSEKICFTDDVEIADLVCPACRQPIDDASLDSNSEE